MVGRLTPVNQLYNFGMAFTLTLKPEVEQRLKELAEAEQRSMHKTVEVAIQAYLDRQVYPTVLDKSAALLHGLMTWRPLDVWNAGLGWAAMRVFLARAGFVLDMPAKERMALTDALVSGEVDSVDELALRLSPYLEMSS